MKDPIRLERYQRWFAVFGTQQGKSVLEDLRKMTGQDKNSLCLIQGNVDEFLTIFHEGRRSVWLDIQACLTEPPEIDEQKDAEGLHDYVK